MAGYIMTLGEGTSIADAFRDGVYSTSISQPDGFWRPHHEGTLADYVTMSEGDDIFFFQERMIYGIGKLKKVGRSHRYLNFPSANEPQPYKPSVGDMEPLLGRRRDAGEYRWICTFVPSPMFFRRGVDMDEALASNPDAFKMLPVLWRLSFIKLDDLESQALRNLLIRRNEDVLGDAEAQHAFDISLHTKIRKVARQNFRLDSRAVVESADDGKGGIKHEAALECRLLDQLSNGGGNARRIFGRWSYLSHQVAASPFKPIIYMDKMDIFGYRYVEGHQAISKYLVCELKTGAASEDDVEQLMKYVDWVASEYCNRDYSQIQAFLVAREFDTLVKRHLVEVAHRGSAIGSHPVRISGLELPKLVTYEYRDGDVRFSLAKA